MKSGPAIGSKLLDRKWKAHNQEIHRRRLRDVKSQIRHHQTPPLVPTNQIKNPKREAIQESNRLHAHLNRKVHWDREREPHPAREDEQHHAGQQEPHESQYI